MNAVSTTAASAETVLRTACPSPAGATPGARAANRRRRMLALLGAWSARRRQRRQLLALSSNPDFLRDVGLSRADAVREAERPFWRE